MPAPAPHPPPASFASPAPSRPPAPPAPAVALALAVAAVLAVLLLVAACAPGPSSPSPSPSRSTAHASSTKKPALSKPEAALAYARCMRTHGLPAFPDPTSHGLDISGGLDTDDPAFQRAFRTCGALLPGNTPERQAQGREQLRRQGLHFAACMRSHGVHDFPDPGADGRFPDGARTDPPKGSPRFSAAQDACRRYLSSNDAGADR